MSADHAKAVACRRWDLLNDHDLDACDDVLAEDFIHHGPGYDFHGREAYKDHIAEFRQGYPGAIITVEETTGNDVWVATTCTLNARQENPVPWSAVPSGEPVTARIVTVHAIADGKIVEEWIVQEWAPGPQHIPGYELHGNGVDGMSMPVSETVIERYKDLWNTGDLAIVDDVLTDDFVLYNSEGGQTAGRAGFKAGIAHHHNTMTGFHVTIDQVVAEGDMAAIRFTASGSHTGRFLGSVPSGKPLAWTGMQILCLRDGRISRIWHQPDDLNLLRQLGRVQEIMLADG